jgi:mRNA interferase RelE/StbE
VSYFISTPKSVQKQLRSLPKAFQAHIIEKIRELSNDPRPSGVKKLRGSNTSAYRVRVGNYRIVSEINDRAKEIYLLEVTDRKDAYR